MPPLGVITGGVVGVVEVSLDFLQEANKASDIARIVSFFMILFFYFIVSINRVVSTS